MVKLIGIKHYGDFRNFWKTRVVLKLACTTICLVLLPAVLVLVMAILGKGRIVISFYLTVDLVVIVRKHSFKLSLSER